MKKSVISLLVVGATVTSAVPATVASAASCPPGGAIYCVPTAPSTAGAAVAVTGKVLSKLTPGGLAAKGSLKVSIPFSEAGTLTLTCKAKLHGHVVTIASASTSAGAAGTSTVKLSLSKAGRRALHKQKGKLTISVAAQFTPAGGGASTSAAGKVALK
jgi:hypothetical protein